MLSPIQATRPENFEKQPVRWLAPRCAPSRGMRRMLTTILLLAVLQRAAPARAVVQHPPSTASSRRSAVRGGGGLSLINGKTLVDTLVSDPSGWCHISLVQPLFSGIILLRMTLNGRGSRVVGAPRTPISVC